MKVSGWFEVNKKGLGKLFEHQGKPRILFELFQNVFDESATVLTASLEPVQGRPLVRLVVEDDSPEGFRDITDAFTLFAESYKKSDPEKRGRFNFGEKMVLALCEEARLISTRGGWEFTKSGERRSLRRARETGTRFEALIRMTRAEYDQVLGSVERIIAPAGLSIIFNGDSLPVQVPVKVFEAVLPTIHADEEGNLRPTTRKTRVELYESGGGEVASIYEMGIPVAEIQDRFHVNILQKVPLTLDRESVRPAYLEKVRGLVLDHAYALLDDSDVTATWVNSAIEASSCPEAITAVIARRHGADAVVADPSDREATQRAASRGVQVIQGSVYSKDARKKIRAAGVLPAAGKVDPTWHPSLGAGIGGTSNIVAEDNYTEGMRQVVALTRRLAVALMDARVDVQIVRGRENFAACYGRLPSGLGCLHFNLFRLGHRWFENWRSELDRTLDLIVHEFGHHYEGSHLDERYHRALTRLGGKLAVLALEKPELFEPVPAIGDRLTPPDTTTAETSIYTTADLVPTASRS